MSTAHPAPTASLESLLEERAWLVALAGRLVKSASEAEDVAQETLTRTIQAGERAPLAVDDSRGALRAWLSITARNVVKERWRGTSRRRAREEEAARSEAVVSNADAVARAELRESLAHHVFDLPETERLAIILRFFEGLDGREIAERLELSSAGAARQRVRRGVAMLRSRLDSADGGRQHWFGVAAGLAGVEAVRTPGGGVTIDPRAALRPAARASRAGLLLGGAAACLLTTVVVVVRSLDRTTATRTDGEDAAIARMDDDLASDAVDAEMVAPEPSAERAAAEIDPSGAAGEAELAVAIPEQIRVVDPTPGALEAATDGGGIPFILGDTGALDQVGEVVILSGPVAYAAIYEGMTGPGGTVSLPGDVELQAYRNDAFGGTPLLALMTRRTDHYARSAFALELTSVERAQDASLELKLRRGATVSGRVVDQNGEPMDATLWVDTVDDTFVRAGRTEADGSFELHHIADLPRSFVLDESGTPFPSRVMSTEIGFTRGEQPFDNNYSTRVVRAVLVGDRPAVRLEDVVLRRPIRVRGKVVDTDGNRVAGAKVSGRNDTLERFGHYQTADSLPKVGDALRPGEVRTDADGTFVMGVDSDPDWGKTRGLFTTLPNGVTSTQEVDMDERVGGEAEVEIVVPARGGMQIALRDRATGKPVEAPRADFTEGVWFRLARGGPGGMGASPRGSFLPLHPGGLVNVRDVQVPRGRTFELLVGGYEPVDLAFDRTSERIDVLLDPAPVLEVTLDIQNVLGVRQDSVQITRRVVGAKVSHISDRWSIAPGDLKWSGPGDATLRLPLHGGQAVELLVGGFWLQGRQPPIPRSFGPFTGESGPQTIELTFGSHELSPRLAERGPWHPSSPMPADR